MFSTVESEDSRILRCWKVSGETISPTRDAIVIPRYLAREELRARVAPTSERLDRLAALLAKNEQTPVVVEVWQCQFDAPSGKLLAEKRSETRGTP